MKRFLPKLLLVAMVFLLLPGSATAEPAGGRVVIGEEGIAESYLPEKSPIEYNETPLYEEYSISSYQLDFENSMAGSLLSPITELLNAIWLYMSMATNLTINAVIQAFVFTGFDGIFASIGQFTDTLKEDLIFGKALTLFIIGFAAYLTWSMYAHGNIRDQLIEVFVVLLIMATVLSNFGTVLKGVKEAGEIGSDAVFLVTNQLDLNHWSNDADKVKDTGPTENARNEALARWGEQFHITYLHKPWLLNQFGKIPTPKEKDKDGNPVYSKEDSQVREDAEKILSWNPMDAQDFLARKEFVAELSDNSFTKDLYNTAVPESIEISQEPAYPMMTINGLAWRIMGTLFTFVLGTLNGIVTLVLALSQILAYAVFLFMGMAFPIVCLTMIYPPFGKKVMLGWLMVFLVAGTYKVLASFVLVAMLWLSSQLYFIENESGLGLGLMYLFHLTVFIGCVVGFKKLLPLILGPGGWVAGKIQDTANNIGKTVGEVGYKGLVAAGMGALAAATGNPAVLGRGPLAKMFQGKGRGAGASDLNGLKQEIDQKHPLVNKDKNYIPKDYNPVSYRETWNSKVLPESNPFQDGSDEAKMFNDMRQKMYNPYSQADLDAYGKTINPNDEEKMSTFNKVQDVSNAFHQRHRYEDYRKRRSQVAKELDMIEKENQQRRVKGIWKNLGRGWKA